MYVARTHIPTNPNRLIHNGLCTATRTLHGDLLAFRAFRRFFLGVSTDGGFGVVDLAGGVHLREMGKGRLELELLETGGDLFSSALCS